ncbi:hypothetical protein HAX54_049611 [Datura stramonium]|uniref:Uncharacterized protein n=1 Tax=Datura stramonium TaxID=4076 RepID=A0ABS8SVZ4_DATST|nr:hypothetical protein [Datura stramonium]
MVVDITKMRDETLVPVHCHLRFLMSVGGKTNVEGVHPDIPLSATDLSTVMPLPPATSEAPQAKLAPQGANSCIRAPYSTSPWPESRVIVLESSSDHSEVKYLREILMRQRAPPPKAPTPIASPTKGPTRPRNLIKMQLVNEKGETEEEYLQEEDDLGMDPVKATQICAAKIKTLPD